METRLEEATSFKLLQKKKGEGRNIWLLIFILKMTNFGKRYWKLDEFGIKMTAMQRGLDVQCGQLEMYPQDVEPMGC